MEMHQKVHVYIEKIHKQKKNRERIKQRNNISSQVIISRLMVKLGSYFNASVRLHHRSADVFKAKVSEIWKFTNLKKANSIFPP